MTLTAEPIDRTILANRLLKTAAKHSLDPNKTVDFAAAPIPGASYCAPERVSIYGTELWEGLTLDQRIELSKHEVASIASVGIWFELILMQMLVRDVYNHDATTAHSQFSFTEIADECRHSTMFGNMINKFGAPAYGPGRVAQLLGKIFAATANPTVAYAGTMFVEEVLDALQREAMADESLQPIVRQVARTHVIEEARHIRFAREEVLRRAPAQGRGLRAWNRLHLALVALVATERLVHPGVYAAVGLDPRQAAAVARRNPHWRATKRFAAGKVLAFLDEQGLVGPITRRAILRPAGLMD